MPDTQPFKRVVAAEQEPLGATATGNNVIKAPFKGTVSKVTYVPVAAVTGAASPASRTLSVVNHRQDGAGNTIVAQLPLVGGVNLVAYDERNVPVSGTAADLAVDEGDVLEFRSAAVGGTGLADPGGTVNVEFTRG